ncbi:MAG: hypothetical protein BJ554DRAFT_853 [Olpidium bornovanus]|uniref:Uncharacterized protein n=1 Tax=Olpidium bornovanus TaxID=278681 RepID=A0A8H8A1M8_9FUNG|nr:MAG: hypothetical protein BJ554DRAFT_853 [Olpidium bornovanus]
MAAVIRFGRQEEEACVPGIAGDPELDGIGFEGRSVHDGNGPGKEGRKKRRKNGVTSTNYPGDDEKNAALPAQRQDRVRLVERTRVSEGPREFPKVNHAAAVGDQFVLGRPGQGQGARTESR